MNDGKYGVEKKYETIVNLIFDQVADFTDYSVGSDEQTMLKQTEKIKM